MSNCHHHVCSPRCMNSQQALPGSTPSISCTPPIFISHRSLTLRTLLITCLTFLAVIPGKLLSNSSAAALTPAPISGSSSAPTAIAWDGSGSALLSLRSLKISAVANGDDDQIMRTRGNERQRRTSLCWMVGIWRSVSDGPTGFFGGYLELDLT